ncbi:MAG: glutathione S-transferase, partial [Actinomycetota bacterium]|nr:glutathione S-transferase [Actinomycetota bacterium]
RRAIYNVLLEHPEVVKPIFIHGQNAAARGLLHVMFPVLRIGMKQILTINDDAATTSRARTVAALDRLEQELDGRDYLVADRFSVADLTAAALFYPFASPPEYPYPIPTDLPAEAQEFLDSVAERPGSRWVAEMYRRHRLPEAAA